MLVIALAVAFMAFTPAQEETQAARSATITRLQEVGSNIATSGTCEIVGYEYSEQGWSNYMTEEREFAAKAGMDEEQSQSFIKAGMDGRAAAILSEMRRNTKLLDAGDKRADPASRAFVKRLAEDCDLLASRSETRRLFDYIPPNISASTAAGYRRLGLVK